ncbi:hypothetical protein FGE12_10810 [Aggregicoccus sp. 17bor-14]|uniref:hypothetical protein n=1 Tax=Myxococcaceae TaxID=31 RepID=UPI00129CC02D|nr:MULTISPECIES: hypothetical protein [Myxococcaceae]MBF5042878.1 hypothetical protein [Simulacricoccus sp. 17bor-14]MRI88645.1 hypothetical protein [Aggregicoccus sp. 17bor-14]
MQTLTEVTQEKLREPKVTGLGDIYQRSGYKALEPPRRPSHWGVDRDYARRPGVPSHRTPQLMSNAQVDIVRMDPARSAPFKHGRSNREWPPVFGTVCQPKGLSGLVRKWANSYPDHKPQHWLLKLLGDRVDSFEHRLAKLAPVAVPLAVAGLLGRRYFAESGGGTRRVNFSAVRGDLRRAPALSPRARYAH